MIKRAVIRSSLFNVLFFTVSLLCCIVLLPALALPRRPFLWIVHIYHLIILALEYAVLGLRYEVRGAEHLPKNGPFLVAAKHMSAYETLKLRLLFDDPAIILKKELLSIPLWGWYLRKSDVIAIDRSTPDKAFQSIEAGARRMKAAGRPVVIFPQGTRTLPEETPDDRPYKSGIHHIQSATDLPVIPMATNSGLFWPRRGWLKSAGTVVFEFLEPVPPGKAKADLLQTLRSQIETRSTALMEEAIAKQNTQTRKHNAALWILTAGAVLALAYSALWIKAGTWAQDTYQDWAQSSGVEAPHKPRLSGFPGPVTLRVPEEKFPIHGIGTVTVHNLSVQSRLWPGSVIGVRADTLDILPLRQKESWRFEAVQARLTYRRDTITILDSRLRRQDFEMSITGSLQLTVDSELQDINLIARLQNHETLLSESVKRGLIPKTAAAFMDAGLHSFSHENGTVEIPIIQRSGIVYAGPIPIGRLKP